jgi:glycosyltransferase involved in cell wall biosynthesis
MPYVNRSSDKFHHIVHLTTAHSAFDVRIFNKECFSLAQQGYEVSLIAPHNLNQVANGIRIIALSPPSRRMHRLFWNIGVVYLKAQQLSADIYHFHDPELLPVGLMLQLSGKKVIYDIHEDTPRSLLSRAYLPKRTRFVFAWLVEKLEAFAAPLFSALVVATPAIRKRFEPFNNNIYVVNNYPRIDELNIPDQVPWQERDNSVAYVGNITSIRGIAQMIEAIAFVPEAFNPTLKLAGNFWPESLRGQMMKLDGWKRVQELGFVDRSQMKNLLGQVRAGLVLFHPEPNHVQSQPNKLFEYMSAGIPIVSSNFPLWQSLVDENECGITVDPFDVCSIADAIDYIFTHPGEAASMGRRGRKSVESIYNWHSEEKKLIELYESLV